MIYLQLGGYETNEAIISQLDSKINRHKSIESKKEKDGTR